MSKKTKKNPWNFCPRCGGPADNGNDRSFPPNAYLCSECFPTPEPTKRCRCDGPYTCKVHDGEFVFCSNYKCFCHKTETQTPPQSNRLTDISKEDAAKLVAEGRATYIPPSTGGKRCKCGANTYKSDDKCARYPYCLERPTEIERHIGIDWGFTKAAPTPQPIKNTQPLTVSGANLLKDIPSPTPEQRTIEEVVREFVERFGGKSIAPPEWASYSETVAWLRTTLTTFKASIEKEAEERGYQKAMVEYMKPIMMTATEVAIEERARIALERAKQKLREEGRTAALTEAIAALPVKREGSHVGPNGGRIPCDHYNMALDTVLSLLKGMKGDQL